MSDTQFPHLLNADNIILKAHEDEMRTCRVLGINQVNNTWGLSPNPGAPVP